MICRLAEPGNYQRLIDVYVAGEPEGKRRAANRKLGGNFDGPILDLEIQRMVI
ncbi:MAG: hypothetical protein P8Y58_04590 [Novosphingobium sp.]